jgi:hypothetical protein
MVADRPAEARVEAEGIAKPPEAPTAADAPAPVSAGTALEAAVLGQSETQGPPGEPASSKPTIESE